jgi:hypothetical protein
MGASLRINCRFSPETLGIGQIILRSALPQNETWNLIMSQKLTKTIELFDDSALTIPAKLVAARIRT